MGIVLPSNIACWDISVWKIFINFDEKLRLLDLLVYQPVTCRDLSKIGYLHCVNVVRKSPANLNVS